MIRKLINPLFCLLVIFAVVVLVARVTVPISHPNPDDPNPPGPVSAAKVLIIEETNPSPPYTPAQFEALSSARIGDIRAWMDTNLGGSHVWDKDLDVSKQDKVWQDGFAKKPETLPCVRYYNGWRWSAGKTFADSAELKKAIGMK